MSDPSGGATAALRVLVIGDPYFGVEDFRPCLDDLGGDVTVDYLQLETTAVPEPRTASEDRLREYAGDPAVVTRAVAGHDVLVVHGAPVSAETLATPGLRLVCCARGGPVNVDIPAATGHGVAVCTSPGKNAVAVAELTVAFVLLCLRGLAASSREFAGMDRLGSVFDGRSWFGTEAAGTTLGLVGLGRVGSEVARRATALGFRVIGHDPFVDGHEGVELVSLVDLLTRSAVVSLHARGGGDEPLMGVEQFAAMRDGACFVNTAREQLVDETALLDALDRGRIRAAALDVAEPGRDGHRNPLVDRPNVFLTPHIGGATAETLRRGAEMAAEAVRALAGGHELPYLADPNVLMRQP